MTTLKEFKVEVLKELQAHRALLTEWQTEAPKTVELSREDLLAQALESLADTIEGVEALDDGPPLQDESELAHNELDLHNVPRLSDADGTGGNALPLWFRIKRLVERDAPADQSEGTRARISAVAAAAAVVPGTWTLEQLANMLAQVQAQLDRLREEQSDDDSDGTS